MYAYILLDSSEVVPDPVTYVWEVFVLHSSQSFKIVAPRVLVWILHNATVHLCTYTWGQITQQLRCRN